MNKVWRSQARFKPKAGRATPLIPASRPLRAFVAVEPVGLYLDTKSDRNIAFLGV
jgi:hypothetical protein